MLIAEDYLHPPRTKCITESSIKEYAINAHTIPCGISLNFLEPSANMQSIKQPRPTMYSYKNNKANPKAKKWTQGVWNQ